MAGEAAARGWGTLAGTDLVRTLPTQLDAILDQIAAAVPFNGHATGNTDTSGYATITHGLGFTPSRILAQTDADASPVSTAWLAVQVSNIGATTFRVRFLYLVPSGVTGEYHVKPPTTAISYTVAWVAYR